MSDELAVSRVTCHAAAVMCNVAPLGAAQWAAVDRRPHGVSIAAHCALLIVSPHTHHVHHPHQHGQMAPAWQQQQTLV